MGQANNATYMLESFHKLVHDLEEPLGVCDSLINLLSPPFSCSTVTPFQCCAFRILLAPCRPLECTGPESSTEHV